MLVMCRHSKLIVKFTYFSRVTKIDETLAYLKIVKYKYYYITLHNNYKMPLLYCYGEKYVGELK